MAISSSRSREGRDGFAALAMTMRLSRFDLVSGSARHRHCRRQTTFRPRLRRTCTQASTRSSTVPSGSKQAARDDRPRPPSSETANLPSTNPRWRRSLPHTTRRNPSNAASRFEDVAASPPEGIALRVERSRGIDRRMHEQQPAPLGKGGMAQRREQHPVARASRSWRCVGRSSNGSSFAGRRGPRRGPAAVRRHRPRKVASTPASAIHRSTSPGLAANCSCSSFCHISSWAPRSTTTSQAKPRTPSGHPPTKVEDLVDGGHDRVAMADDVAEIDNPIAVAKPLADEIVQPCQPACLAMHGADRPYPSGALAGRRASGPLPPRFTRRSACPRGAGGQAASICSTRWVAVVSSIRSTAANSRTNRSSAAW